jgi:hypothetical protein
MNTYQERFNTLTAKLRSMGYTGEVLLDKNGLFLTALDSFSVQVLRVASRRNRELVTYKPTGSSFMFACYIPDATPAQAKAELKKLAA